MTTVFGRTNIPVGHRWVEAGPEFGVAYVDVLPEGSEVCVRGNAPVNGHFLRPRADLVVGSFSGFEAEKAYDEAHAYTLTSAVLIQNLSSLGRGKLDFFFVQLRRALEEYQWAGVLGAVEDARSQGLVRFVGLEVCGPLVAVLSQWRFHDAFEVVLAPGTPAVDLQSVKTVAEAKRVGVVAKAMPDRLAAAALSQSVPVLFRPGSVEECAEWTANAP